MPSADGSIVYEFGGYVLDPERRQLRSGRSEVPVPLPSRVFDTLVCFVERPNRLLSKAALLEAIWPDAAVEENSLSRNISILRRALGDTAAPYKLILTDQGRGYRFVAEVRAVPRAPVPAAAPIAAGTQDLITQARALSVRPSAENLRGALELLELAAARDPQCAAAHSMLARVQATFLVFDLPVGGGVAAIEKSARRAVELEPGLGDALAALGLVRALQGRWIEAEEHFRSALALGSQPDTAAVHITMVVHSVGHFERALNAALELHRAMPGDSFFPVCIAIAHAALGDDEQARRFADVARSLGQPRDQAPLQDVYAQLALRAGDYDTACKLTIAGLTPAMRAAGGEPAVERVFAALAGRDDSRAALAALHGVEDAIGDVGQVDTKRLLRWYTALGDVDAAYAALNRCLGRLETIGMVGSAWGALWEPELRAFRGDARFGALARRLGFEDYWLRYGPPSEPGARVAGSETSVSPRRSRTTR